MVGARPQTRRSVYRGTKNEITNLVRCIDWFNERERRTVVMNKLLTRTRTLFAAIAIASLAAIGFTGLASASDITTPEEFTVQKSDIGDIDQTKKMTVNITTAVTTKEDAKLAIGAVHQVVATEPAVTKSIGDVQDIGKSVVMEPGLAKTAIGASQTATLQVQVIDPATAHGTRLATINDVGSHLGATSTR